MSHTTDFLYNAVRTLAAALDEASEWNWIYDSAEDWPPPQVVETVCSAQRLAAEIMGKNGKDENDG